MLELPLVNTKLLFFKHCEALLTVYETEGLLYTLVGFVNVSLQAEPLLATSLTLYVPRLL